MKPGAGKAKGNQFERDIAKRVSLWLTGGTDKTQLVRSVSSGGWETRKLSPAESWRQVGDLAPNGPHGEWWRRRFGMECKHYKEIVWWQEFNDTDSTLFGFWQQVCSDCMNCESADPFIEPMLFIRANNRPILVGMREVFLHPTVFPALSLTLNHADLRFITLDDFLEHPPAYYVDRWQWLHVHQGLPNARWSWKEQ